MEFIAVKYLPENSNEIPNSFEDIYYNPASSFFGYYACSLIVKGDGSYILSGPDEGLKKWLDDTLKERHNMLEITFPKKVGNTSYQMSELVSFFDPRFKWAFNKIVSIYGVANEFSYSGADSFRKVNSLDEIKKLDFEYEAWLDNEIS